MMRSSRKPDSSYARTWMTRRNAPQGHLLSIFNKPSEGHEATPETEPSLETKAVADEEKSSSSDGELSSLSSDAIDGLQEEPEVQPRGDTPDVATDAEPLSSSAEESDEDEIKGPAQETKQTLAEKLAENESKISSSPSSIPSSSRASQKRSYTAHRGGLVRAGSNIFDLDSEEDAIFSSWGTQNSKRSKLNKSYSRNQSFSGAPSSSARSAATPDKRARKGKAKGGGGSEEPESDVGFKVPMDIDIESPMNPQASKAEIEESPKFKVPQTISFDSQILPRGDNTPDPPLSPPLRSPPPDGPPPPAHCPWCKEEVDRELLNMFEAQPRKRIREQQRFCESHRQNAAERQWETQGYPNIDWDMFEDRVKEHFAALEQLLVPECSSYYRNILDTKLKSGEAKNFRLTLSGDSLETISCGYYGTRGAAKMLQAIVDRFSLKLRRLAANDEIVKKAGVAGYAQCVLVPELALRLVKEDMKVDDESARQILRDSIDIGHKLNPAMDDVVPIPEKRQDEHQDEHQDDDQVDDQDDDQE